MNNPTIKVCCEKATLNKVDEVFISHELTKQFHGNRYGNEVKIYQSWPILLKMRKDHFLYPFEINMALAVSIWAKMKFFYLLDNPS